MKQLEQSFTKNDMAYNLYKRADKVAMYTLSSKSSGTVVAYEVFDIPTQKATTVNFGGTSVELLERERIPSNEEFGIRFRSKSYNNKNAALAHFDYLGSNPVIKSTRI